MNFSARYALIGFMYFRGSRNNKMKVKIYQAFLALMVIGLVFSSFLTSVSMIGLVVLTAFYWQDFRKGRIFGMWFILLFFNMLILVGSDPDIPYWMNRLRVHLPFLLLPITFLFLPVLTAKQYLNFHLFFAFVLLIGCIQSMILYYGGAYDYQEHLKMGQSIPVPTRSHIRFSMMLVYILLILIWIWWKGQHLLDKWWEKVAVIIFTGFLFISIHWLAVRSGLLILYSIVSFNLIRHIWIAKSWRLGFWGLLFFIGMPVLSFFCFPSFKAKVGYTIYEVKMVLEGQGQGYSNGDRIASIIDGWRLFKNHPIWGIGTGSLRAEMKEMSSKEYSSELDVLIPHNQWVIEAAEGGVVGLSIFIIGFLMPFLSRNKKVYHSFYLIYGVVGISMLFEPTLETAEGIGLFLLGVLVARKE